MACSVLSILIDSEPLTFGKLPLVKRFMKGILEQRPVFSKYNYIWDVNKVFEFFRGLPSLEDLDLKMLSYKLVMLLCLVSGGQRAQTIHSLCLKDIHFIEESIAIPIMSKIKQTMPGKHMKPLFFRPYENDPKLCC